MQTFLPSTNFKQSAQWLDRQRLGKQRLETADALAMLLGQPPWMSDRQFAYISKKYKNHPAWRMWCGYEFALIEYGIRICLHWRIRGYKDQFLHRIREFGDMLEPHFSMNKPHWLTEEFASNRRSILLGKIKEKSTQEQRDWYQSLKWTEEPAQRVNGKWPYLWPEGNFNN